ncbi:ubiquinone biosynthesis regulatory protein kinase UbiB [Psychrosphaera haliotis]|nr:ubiquinone biosynthesis regulatory protein kinase UbiB [Psychrosphaera haliotis]
MRLVRFFQIFHTFLYFRLFDLIPKRVQPWYLRVLLGFFFWYPKAPKNQSKHINLRLALEGLGPVWIKFGQMLSTRKDLLSPELSLELTKLQDQVPPFSSELAIKTIKQELNLTNINDLLIDFEPEPLASASIAQVHCATINLGTVESPDHKAVVVKVIRPNIEKLIQADVALMLVFAKLVDFALAESKRLRPVEVVEEYKKTILNELNLQQEAANGLQLKRNFEQSDDLYIPDIYSDFCTQNVLVMERIYGIPVSDIAQLNAQGSDLKKLAERGVRVFFTQVFRDSFFHADMHPGNIFISKETPSDPQYIGIDFGIIGTLNSEDKRYLAENFVAFFNRDYLKVAQLHVQSGWVPSHINVEQFEMAIRSVCDPIFNKPLEDISFAQVLIGLFDTARQFEMQVQPQLVLLQKTLLYVEGLGRQLYPKLDLWETAKPFLEDWVSEQMGVKAFLKQTKQNLPYWLEKAPQMPELVFSSLKSIEAIPKMKQDLVSEYTLMQHRQQQFFKRLCIFSISSLAVLLITLFADVNGDQRWFVADCLLALLAAINAWKLRK